MSATDSEVGSCLIEATTPLINIYLADQMLSQGAVTDLHLACEDGFIPVHRFIIMGASPMLFRLLINQDPSELSIVHLPGVKLIHCSQVVSLLYTGRCVVNDEDQSQIFKALKALGMSPNNIQFRPINTADQEPIPRLRTYRTKDDEDGEENIYVNDSVTDEASEVQTVDTPMDSPTELGSPTVLSESGNTKQRKRKRRKVAAYDVGPRKRSNKVKSSVSREEKIAVAAAKLDSLEVKVANKEIPNEDGYNWEFSDESSASTQHMDAAENLGSVNGAPISKLKYINPDILRNKLGLNPSDSLADLSADTVNTILHRCPLCQKECERLSDVAKCLRYHGYRYCYCCFQILPNVGSRFMYHCRRVHQISVTNPKGMCPFCSKDYEFLSALPTHLAQVHSARTAKCDISERTIDPMKVLLTEMPTDSTAEQAQQQANVDHPMENEENIKSREAQQSTVTPTNTKKKKQFLHQKMIDGVLYNIYSYVGDVKRTIALPAPALSQSQPTN